MRICHCNLGGTKACENCPNNQSYSGAFSSFPPQDVFFRPVKPSKRIIKEYDDKGNLIKEIIEE